MIVDPNWIFDSLTLYFIHNYRNNPQPLPHTLSQDAGDDFNIGDREPSEFGSDFKSAADDDVDIRTKQGEGNLPRKIASAGGGDAPFPIVDEGVEGGGGGGCGGSGGGDSLHGNDEDLDAKEIESAMEDEPEDGVVDDSQRRVNKDRRQYSRYFSADVFQLLF